MVESICTRSCECRAIPRILVTGSHIVCGVIVLGDCEVQGVCAGAAIVVCIVICICAALSVVDIVPGILLTCILMIGVVGAAIDYEVESVNVSTR